VKIIARVASSDLTLFADRSDGLIEFIKITRDDQREWARLFIFHSPLNIPCSGNDRLKETALIMNTRAANGPRHRLRDDVEINIDDLVVAVAGLKSKILELREEISAFKEANGTRSPIASASSR